MRTLALPVACARFGIKITRSPPIDAIPRSNLIISLVAAGLALLLLVGGLTMCWIQRNRELRELRTRRRHRGSIDHYSFPQYAGPPLTPLTTYSSTEKLRPNRTPKEQDAFIPPKVTVVEEPSPFMYDPVNGMGFEMSLASLATPSPAPTAWPSDSRLYYTPQMTPAVSYHFPPPVNTSKRKSWRISGRQGHQPSLGVTMEEEVEREPDNASAIGVAM